MFVFTLVQTPFHSFKATKTEHLSTDKCSVFCLSKPQAWHIIDARSAAYIIKGGEPPLYLITRQRVSSYALIYLQKCGIMREINEGR